jgi:predicted nucleotidyltransferase
MKSVFCRKDFQKEVESIVEQVRVKYKPERIVLFGSSARGTMHEGSDVDLLIVKETSKRRVDRVKEVLSLVDYNIPFEPVVYTNKELAERLELGDPFVKKALREGKVLYGSET